MVYGYQAGYRPPQQQQPSPQQQPGGPKRQVPYVPPAQRPAYGGGGGKSGGPGGGSGNGKGPTGGNGGKGAKPPQGPKGPQRPPQPPRKKKKGKGVLSFFLILLLVGVIVLGTYGYILYRDVNGQGDVFYEGVYVGGLHVGGMTPEQATVELASLETQQLGQWRVDLRLNDKVQSIEYTELNLHLDLQDQLRAAWQVGREGGLLERQQIIRHLREEPYYTQGGISFDADRLDNILTQIKLGLDRAPEDATAQFNLENENPFTYTQEVQGRSLETSAIREQIVQSIYSLQPVSIDLAQHLTDIPPNITVAMLQSELAHIVTVSTQINTSSTADRNENIRVALERFNGLRVLPNERVSFNKIAQRRTEENGYKPGLEIVRGEYVEGIGGGVCQVSTTLFQAVLRANLEVVDRRPHGLPPNYAEMGQDATVADDRTDFVFKNNTDMPIYIRARIVESSNSKTKRCEISIYGKPFSTEYTYTLETEQTQKIEIPEPEYIDDRKAKYVTYRGEEHVLSKGRPGYKVVLYRLKMKDGMEVEREKILEDYYTEKAPVIYVGVQSRD